MNESNITALLLNWKRPENIKKTIQSIRNQDVNVNIWLWNNNPEDKTKYDVDMQINSPQNFKCWPRWLMGSLVNTDYVFTLDDDLTFKDNNTLRIMMEKHKEHHSKLLKENGNVIVGLLGLNAVKNDKPYTSGKDFKPSNILKDTYVDIIKGRCMFMNSSLLNKVTLEYDGITDDIKISSFSDLNVLTPKLKGKFHNLTEGQESLYKQKDHFPKRNKATKKYHLNK